ncbi:pirin family protein [Actinoplanes sp. GCM10030250]|uniref:pirin family protein n=1 Tax=Actinoplanes sp. GCM10030250 TaxID=3273376 RepID=UPI00360F8FFE
MSLLLLPGHDVPLGRWTTVRRLLPHRERRMIGAWCFVDHFGPDDVSGRPGMRIPPHPHTGLQTVTWLADGIIEHRDSLGSHQLISPGQLNLMTSGNGIAHSEFTPPDHPDGMHGLQLWLALPDGARHGPARFEHHASLPTVSTDTTKVTVVIGQLGELRSPATVHTPLAGAEILFTAASRHVLDLDPAFEHGLVVMSGTATVTGDPLLAADPLFAGGPLEPGSLLYLGDGRTTLTIDTGGPARLFLVGGEPFDEPLVMWWNFVGRTHEDIVAAREDWMASLGGARFGTVTGCAADPLPAPELPTVRLKARNRHGKTF